MSIIFINAHACSFLFWKYSVFVLFLTPKKAEGILKNNSVTKLESFPHLVSVVEDF